jgi:L-seryl-tRNA(Ser) seleniumtransferase
MLSAPASEIAARARRLMDRLPTRVGARIIDGFSTSGGGTAPDSKLPTALLTLDVNGMTADEVSARLRRNDPPIVGRIQDERFVLDLRTVAADDDPIVAEALTSLDRD